MLITDKTQSPPPNSYSDEFILTEAAILLSVAHFDHQVYKSWREVNVVFLKLIHETQLG